MMLILKCWISQNIKSGLWISEYESLLNRWFRFQWSCTL